MLKIPAKSVIIKEIASYGGIIIGSLLMAAAFALFNTPYKVTPGGVYGIGIIINYFFPNIMVGTIGLSLDIPLLIIFFLVFGKGAGVKTIVSALCLPIFMNIITTIIGGTDPAIILDGKMNLTNDVLLASIYGGVLCGAGLGIIVRTGATSGGTDVVAMLIAKFFKCKFTFAMILVEASVILSGMILFGDWKLPLYSLISLFLTSAVIDIMVDGPSTDKMLLIISDKHEDIRNFILNDLERGGTYLKATGMYTNNDKEVIFVVLSRNQLPMIKSFIYNIDPLAFITVVSAHETFGDGFKQFNK